MKVIKYITRNQYGIEREFIHDSQPLEAALIRQLTGKKCICQAVREEITALSGGSVTFEQVMK